MKPAGRILLPVLALALVSAGGGPAPRAAGLAAVRAPATPGPSPTTGARLVTLRNGMQLLLAPDPAATAVDVAVWSRAGAARERDGITGMSRLFESLMFADSADHGSQEHRRLIAAAGGQAAAYTTADLACYHETVPSGSLDLALELEADRIASLRLSPQALGEAVRATGEAARRQAEAQPWGAALQAFYDLAWGTHPYHRMATGPLSDLARITLADCEAYHAAAFAPNELLVTITGRFDPDLALPAARRLLEPLPRRHGIPAASAATAQKAARRGWERLDVPLDLVIAGWKLPGHAVAATPELGLLVRILATGRDTRLQRALLADSTGCMSVQVALDARREGGLLYVMAAVKPGADSARVERELIGQMEKLAHEPVTDEELDRARRQEEMSTLLGWQTVRGCADALGSAQVVDGDWRAAALRFERVRQSTAEDLQHAAARVLVPAGRTVLWVSTTRPDVPPPAGSGQPRPGQPSSQGGR
jgi:zinc protease